MAFVTAASITTSPETDTFPTSVVELRNHSAEPDGRTGFV